MNRPQQVPPPPVQNLSGESLNNAIDDLYSTNDNSDSFNRDGYLPNRNKKLQRGKMKPKKQKPIA